MNEKSKIVIIGGGQAAVYAAKEIRKYDQYSNIKIISEENEIAYEKPPLSKDYLINKKKFEDFLFFPINFYSDNNIEYIKNNKIIDVDFIKKELISNKKEKFIFDKLLIATGSVNRKLDLKLTNNHDKILYLRNNLDSEIIKSKIQTSNKVLIIGGGFIGLEIASSCRSLGKETHLIEMGEQLMGRSIPKKISKICKDVHEKNGNIIYLNTKVNDIENYQNSFKVKLSNDKTIIADLIIVGIGSVASTDLFINKGIKINNGISTNQYCETSLPDVYAAGDVSNFYHPFYKKFLRLESYQHAQNQGIYAGKNIAGIKEAYKTIPWMWSDQFDINIQLTGICDDYDEVFQRGSKLEEGIINFFIKNKKIQGACGIGFKGKIGKDIKIASKVIEKNLIIEKNNIIDKNYNLTKLLKKS